MNRGAGMPSAQINVHPQIRQTVNFKEGRGHHFPLEIQAPLIGARWHAEQITKLFVRQNLYAVLAIGAEANQFVKGDGVLACHGVSDLTTDSSPAVRFCKYHPQAFWYSKLHGCVAGLFLVGIREFQEMSFHHARLTRSRRYVCHLHFSATQAPRSEEHTS